MSGTPPRPPLKPGRHDPERVDGFVGIRIPPESLGNAVSAPLASGWVDPGPRSRYGPSKGPKSPASAGAHLPDHGIRVDVGAGGSGQSPEVRSARDAAQPTIRGRRGTPLASPDHAHTGLAGLSAPYRQRRCRSAAALSAQRRAAGPARKTRGRSGGLCLWRLGHRITSTLSRARSPPHRRRLS